MVLLSTSVTIVEDLQDAEDRSIAVAIHQALVPSVRLELLPKSTIDVFITVIEADGMEGCISSGVVAASTALADAGIEMLGLVMSCSAVCMLFRYSDCSDRPQGSCRKRNMVRSYSRGSSAIARHVSTVLYARVRNHNEPVGVRPDESRGGPSSRSFTSENVSMLILQVHESMSRAMCRHSFCCCSSFTRNCLETFVVP
jgi:3' exoribonuclease family, domain 1